MLFRSSSERTLLGQVGSSIVFGDFQTIPVGHSFLYVQPAFVRAAQENAIPELKFVLVANGDTVGVASNLADVGNKMELANPATQNGLAQAITNHSQWMAQVQAIGVTLVLAIVGTTVIAFIVKALVGLRAGEEVETVGLDLTEHGEEGYHLS